MEAPAPDRSGRSEGRHDGEGGCCQRPAYPCGHPAPLASVGRCRLFLQSDDLLLLLPIFLVPFAGRPEGVAKQIVPLNAADRVARVAEEWVISDARRADLSADQLERLAQVFEERLAALIDLVAP